MRGETNESSDEPVVDGITAFWQFWAENCDQIAAAVDDGTLVEWTPAVGAAADRIDPNLAWEFGAGTTANHFFCLSAEGDMALRVVVQRWLLRAPPSDTTWEFYVNTLAPYVLTRRLLAIN